MTTRPSPTSRYPVDLPVFSGPLELLLHLIERNELDITAISLMAVTEQFLAYVDQLKEERLTHLMDFLVIGARLLLIKSRALLPRPPAPPSDDEEEDPAEALARQIRNYKRFKAIAAWLGQREAEGLRSYLRVAPPPRLEGTLDLTGISLETLVTAFQGAMARTRSRDDSVTVAVDRPRFTLEGQVGYLRSRLQHRGRVTFAELLSDDITWPELSVTLLAVLELIKRQEVVARQAALFGPIELLAGAAAPGQASGGGEGEGATPAARS